MIESHFGVRAGERTGIFKQTAILISPAELISIINTLSFITSLHLMAEDNSRSCSSFSGFPGTAESCTTDL